MHTPQWTGLAAAIVSHGCYRPIQQLGKRPGRQALLAEEIATGKQVVIKLLTFGEDFAWDDLKLFEREAETLRSLDHPAIPQYLDYFELETSATKGFALVQTYLEAKSLKEQLRQGRTFSEAEILQIAHELLTILKYLHNRQPPVIHRDIKPSNILLSDRTAHSAGNVYLVDFGSVQTLTAREGGTVTVVGTYGYMPPEQFGGRAVPASDLYGLGATLIYLASGRHPADLPQNELKIQFDDFVQLNPRIVAWLRQLTEPSLGRRMQSVEQALASLHEKSQDVSQEASTEPSWVGLLPDETAPLVAQITLNRHPNGNINIKLPSRWLQVRKIDDNNVGWAGYIMILGPLLGIPLAIFVVTKITGAFVAGDFQPILFALFVIGLVVWNLWAVIHQPRQHTSVVLNKTQILIERSGTTVHRFKRAHVWRVLHDTDNNLALAIGTEELVFRGSPNELARLKCVLDSELAISTD